MKTLIALLWCVPLVAYAALDRIDAVGITEVGGDPGYAKMIPRTQADGRLNASLLPPVADWASKPIPGLYYVAQGAAVSGNGSPQYPFNALTPALDGAATGSAIVLAPGDYSGTCTLTGGRVVTLCGFGAGTVVSSITVDVDGEATIRLCSMRIGKLVARGGSLTVVLAGATVDTLSGTASAVSVARMDLGARVVATTREYSDSYTGHDTIAKAEALTAPHGMRLVFDGDRLVTTTNTVAYTADVDNATNSLIRGTIGRLQDEDARLGALVLEEQRIRASSDTAISNTLTAAIDNIATRVGNLGDGWNDRLNSLSANVSGLSTALTALGVKEGEDVAELHAAILDAREASDAADSELSASISADMATRLTALRDEIPGIADTRAQAQIETARPGIIDDAVAQANTNASLMFASANTNITVLKATVAVLTATSQTHTATIRQLVSKDDVLGSLIDSLAAREAADIRNVRDEIGNTAAAYKAADNALAATLRGEMGALEVSVPGTAASQARIAIDNAKQGIIATAKTNANAYTDAKIAAVSTSVATLSGTVDELGTAVSTHSTRIGANTTGIAALNTANSALDKKVESYSANTQDALSNIRTRQDAIESRMANVESLAETCKSKINAIIAALNSLKSGTPIYNITIPSTIP